MPVTFEHEGLAKLFQNRPSFAAELLAHVFGLHLPAFTKAKNESPELTRVVPDQFFADAASVYYDAKGKPAFGALVEVQRELDPDKRRAWPVYLTVHGSQHDCPTWLLVIATKPSVARWAAEPIELGHPGFVLTPLVLGPATTPIVTDRERALAAPELAVLSAQMHGASERGAEVALVAFEAISAAFLGTDDDRLRIYADLVHSSLSGAVRRSVEAIMASGNYEYQSEFAKRYVSQGRAEGKAEGIIEGLQTAVLDLCELLGIKLGAARRTQLEAMNVDELEALRLALKQNRRWPDAAGAGAPRTTARTSRQPQGATPTKGAKKR